jgi:hypothetical protein
MSEVSTVYYDPGNTASYSTSNKLRAAVKHAKPGKLKTCLEAEDAYTLHRPIRKRFPTNSYGVIISWTCGKLISLTSKI